MPNVLGNESSGSKGGGEQVALGGRSRRAKAPRVEESEDEFDDGLPLAQPQDPVPPIGSHHEEGIERVATQGIFLVSVLLVLIFLLCFCFLLYSRISLPSLLQAI